MTCTRYRSCPEGQEKSPWLGGPAEMVPVVCSFLTGNVPVVVSDEYTVSLLPAFGCFPPWLKHWYVAVALSTVSVTCSVTCVLPSPASLKDTPSAPDFVLTLEFAKRKCGLSAMAAGTAKAMASAVKKISFDAKRISVPPPPGCHHRAYQSADGWRSEEGHGQEVRRSKDRL